MPGPIEVELERPNSERAPVIVFTYPKPDAAGDIRAARTESRWAWDGSGIVSVP